MPADLSDRSTALVKATVAALEQHGLAITRRMHERMFRNEAIRGLFNQSHHGETGSHHARGPRLRELAARSGGAVTAHVFDEQPRGEDVRGRDYDGAGLITPAWLERHTPVAEADYYLCGPRPFPRSLVAALAQAGVPASRTHCAFFGPADELLAA